MKIRILLIPALKKGSGSGHLIRCLSLLNELGRDVYLYIDDSRLKQEQSIINWIKEIEIKYKDKIINKLDNKNNLPFIIFDQQKTSYDMYERFSHNTSIIVGIDEGGKCRRFLHYTIDTLLNKQIKDKYMKPNIYSTFIKNQNNKKIQMRFPFKKILISFGGEDPLDLSSLLIENILGNNIFPLKNITIVEGPLFRKKVWPEGINILRSPNGLVDSFYNYDLLFTHFGMTCIEALYSGLPVILFNPSVYHQKLSKEYRIPYIGVKRPDKKKLKKLLKQRKLFEDLILGFSEKKKKFPIILKDAISSLNIEGNIKCPICFYHLNKSVGRFTDKTYFKCKKCKIIYLIHFRNKKNKYLKEYFFKEYSNKYGKTYLEDYNNIKKISQLRIKIIEKIIRIKKIKLLDIGCAYGPFLEAALENGWDPVGIDISDDATSYINKVLKIKCICGDFTKSLANEYLNQKYDIVTMWYVIEHFKDIDLVLTKVNFLLKMDGVIALSTPNGSGISSLKNRRKYLENSPDDHYTIWNPKVIKKILYKYGFEVRKINITGHHPERFPLFNKFDKKWNRIPFVIFKYVSRLFGLGDTFEVFAVKVKG